LASRISRVVPIHRTQAKGDAEMMSTETKTFTITFLSDEDAGAAMEILAESGEMSSCDACGVWAFKSDLVGVSDPTSSDGGLDVCEACSRP
jgi:hypothetical protein